MEIEKLKAMAYDLIAQREAITQRLNQVIQAIQQEQQKAQVKSVNQTGGITAGKVITDDKSDKKAKK